MLRYERILGIGVSKSILIVGAYLERGGKMVRFAHFGDTHLCRTFPTEQRVSAFNYAFETVIGRMIEEDVDFAIHTGDLFDKLHPWPSVVKHLKEQLYRLQREGIPLYIIRGNHDGTSDIQGLKRGSSIELTYHPLAENVVFIDPRVDEISRVSTIGYRDFEDEVRIFGVGYYGFETSQYFDQYVKPQLSGDRLNILATHIFVDGYTLTPPGEPTVKIDALNLPHLTYVALGHDHNLREPRTLREGVMVACSGSTERWDFNEKGGKGFYIVELSDSKRRVTTIPIETEQYMTTLTVEAVTPQLPRWFVEEAKSRLKRLAESTSKRLIVRVEMKGELQEGTILDIPLDELNRFASSYQRSSQLLYFEAIPPDIRLKMEDVEIVLEQLDVRKYLTMKLGDPALAEEAYQVHSFLNRLLEDESNLTRDKNLRKEALEELLREISQRWGGLE